MAIQNVCSWGVLSSSRTCQAMGNDWLKGCPPPLQRPLTKDRSQLFRQPPYINTQARVSFPKVQQPTKYSKNNQRKALTLPTATIYQHTDRDLFFKSPTKNQQPSDQQQKIQKTTKDRSQLLQPPPYIHTPPNNQPTNIQRNSRAFIN